MAEKPSYARNCAFNQCIQPQICEASAACIWNAGDVPMTDGPTVTGKIEPSAEAATQAFITQYARDVRKTTARMAAEYGYKAAERGDNMEQMLRDLEKLIGEE